MQRDRPLSLQATINTPTVADDPSDPSAPQLNGFVLLANLFRPFDDELVSLWNKTRANCSPYVNALQKQFAEVLPAYLSNDPQMSDPSRNQQWLKNLAWQISMANGNLSSNPNDLPYQYPVEVSRDLLDMASSFSAHGTQLINVGLVRIPPFFLPFIFVRTNRTTRSRNFSSSPLILPMFCR